MSIFNSIHHVNAIHYAQEFVPMARLTEEQKVDVVFNRYEYFTKQDILQMCNENKNALICATSIGDSVGRSTWAIRWVDNRMPTEAEWNSLLHSQTIMVEFRVVRGHGRFALLKKLGTAVQSLGLFACDTMAR